MSFATRPPSPARISAAVLATLTAIIVTACGPCEASTDVIVCDVGTLGGSDATDASTSGESSADETGAYDGICSILPGFEWGPCIAGGCPNAIVPSVCVVGDLGAVCEPYCSSGCTGHLDLDCAVVADGMCAAPGAACHLPCNSWCPDPNMVCDPSIDGGACVWPSIPAPQCEGVDVPGQPFAPCLADFTCNAPETICATDSNGAVCIPVTSDTCAEDHQGCAGPVGFGVGYGAQVDACTLACSADTDCAVAGMVCGQSFGLCVWT